MLRQFFEVAVIAVWVGAGIERPSTAKMLAHRPVLIGSVDGQAAGGEKLAFEVATVKPNTTDDDPYVNFTFGPGDGYAQTGGRMRTRNISLLDYIRFAYKLSDGQVRILQASAPGWIGTKKFDLEAKAGNPEATKDQMRLMMQSLLADRFGLKAHLETRQMPVLAMVMAKPGKLGPGIRVHDPSDTGCSKALPGMERAEEASGPAVCGGFVSVGGASSPSHVRIGGRRVPLSLLAAHLGEMAQFDRPLVDETGLAGTFDLVLGWGPDASGAGSAPDAEDRQTNVEEALQDQLGLKLKRERAGVEVLVIDAINPQPTEN